MLTIDASDAARVTTKVLKYAGKVDRVLVRAINRSIASARTVIVKLSAADTGLKSKTVRDAMILREATLASPEATLKASAKRIPRIDFDAKGPRPSRGRGTGVTYKGLNGGRIRAAQAFIATTASGHEGVFERAAASTRKSNGAWSKNLPIFELKGPSLWHVFTKYREQGLARAREAMVTNLAHELAFANNDEYADVRAGLGLDV